MSDVEHWLVWFNHPLSLYLLSLFGMLVHYIKEKFKDDSLASLVSYMRCHTLTFFMSFGITTILFATFLATLQTGKPLDYMAVFTLGYTVDSFFNKYDQTKIIKPK